ncbi:MAG: DEAD/DEAH box helicase [Sandaracinaceae bacterium]
MTENSVTFAELGLDARILEELAARGYETPTPIQAQAIPVMLARHDMIGRARTGSGKTAAFGLPLLHALADGPSHTRALVLAPTRELALQVAGMLKEYGKRIGLRVATVYGGAPYPPQLKALAAGAPIVVGTPGRLLDHLSRGSLDLSRLEVLVIDEADELLRMGFLEDVEALLEKAPEERQIALFSATMPLPIQRIADRYLRDPSLVSVEKQAMTTSHIAQRWVRVPERHKLEALIRILDAEHGAGTLVFTRTKAACDETATKLAARGFNVDALHGDLSQSARELVLSRLRARRVDVLVATDVAARGIDIEHLSHVINFDLPHDPESYVHRVGRTGRAGREGAAISLVTPREVGALTRFAKTLDQRIEPMVVPSDLEIQTSGCARLEQRVRDRIGFAPSALGEVADALLAGAEPRAALAAALAIIAETTRLELKEAPSASPPSWAQPPRAIEGDARRDGRSREGRSRDERPRDERSRDDRPRDDRPRGDRPRGAANDEGHVGLFIRMGKSKGLRPSDLVGTLTNELGVPREAIGKIRIGLHTAIFTLEQEIGEALLHDEAHLPLRGHDVQLVRERTDTGERPARRPPFKGKSFKGKPREDRSGDERPFKGKPRADRSGDDRPFKGKPSRRTEGGPGEGADARPAKGAGFDPKRKPKPKPKPKAKPNRDW